MSDSMRTVVPTVMMSHPRSGLWQIFLGLLCALVWAGTCPAQTIHPGQVGSGSLLARHADGYTSLPLLGMEVHAEIEGVLVHCELEQVFHNPGPEAVEAVYVFPLPERAAVDALELQIGERRIVGEIHEREEAKRIYAQAKRDGKKASLLEQERPNLFTISVANIRPGETVQVHLRYLEELQLEDGDFSFTFPMTFTPRYLPRREVGASPEREDLTQPVAHSRSPSQDAARVLPPFRSAADCGAPKARVSVRLRTGWPAQDVRSISHDIALTENGPEEWSLVLKDGVVPADRDFHLRWTPIQTDEAQVAFLTESRSDGDYGLVMLLPPREGAITPGDLPTETLFILDVSGSMDGPSIEQARRALQAALDRLAPRDRFNLLAFNGSTLLFRPHFQSAGAVELEAARRWVGNLRADGGTEILGALRRGLDLCGEGARRSEDDHHQRIIFVTDGAVGNELDVLSEVRQSLGKLRVHTLGIGHAPNRYLMNKMAEYGRGHCEYLSTDPDLESRMGNFLERIARPAVTSLQVKWTGVQATDLSPELLPDLYSGQPLYLSVKLKKSSNLRAGVTVSGRVGSREFSRSVSATKASVPNSGIGTRWARRHVAHWMDEAILGTEEEVIRRHVTELGRAFHLVTRYTSFVAVEQFATVQSAPRVQRVPNALPHGSQLGGTLPLGGTDRSQRVLLAVALGLLGFLLWGAAGTGRICGEELPRG